MSLRVWLPLNGDLHNQGLSNITVANNGATVNSSGKIGSCYYFNGSAQYLQFSDSLGNIYSNDFSWAVWLKPTDDTRGIIISEYSSAGASNVAFELLANRVIRVYWNGSPDWSFSAIPKDVWSHVAITKHVNTIKVYINGVESGSKTTTLSARPSTAKIRIGDDYRGGTNVSYMGYMNDVRIYDHALSALEVKEIARAKVLHYPLNHNGMGNKNLLTNDWNLTAWSKESGISVSWDDTVGMYKVLDSSHTSSRWGIYQNITLTANTTYTFSVDGMKKDQNVNFGFAEGTSWPANAGSFTTTVSRLSKTITVGSADANCRIYLNINPVSNGSNYGYFRAPKLEIGSVATPWGSYTDNTIEYDISGYCNNGTKVGTFTYSTDTPKYRVSTSFDGTNAIKYTNFNLGNIWSAGLWFNAASNITSGWESLFAVNNNGGDSDLKMNLYLNTSNGNIQYSANGQYIVVSLAAPNKNTWYHLFETFDGTTLSCYVNGVLKTTKTITNTEFTRSNLYISGRSSSTDGSTSGNKFHGKLSDFRIYATALSAQDILSLYHNSALVDEQGIVHGAIH